jgi:hypothetical protein
MLAEVEVWLHEIALNAHTLLFTDVGVLNPDQKQMVESIWNCAEHIMPRLLPALGEWLPGRSPREAVLCMTTEWRTPICAIRAYARLLLDEFAGPLEEAQIRIVEGIRDHAERLWEWSRSS